MKRLVLMLSFLLAFPKLVFAENVPEKVSEQLGYKLAVIAIDWPGQIHKTGVLKNTTGFLIYQIDGRYEDRVGWYAVNRWTGDVWDINGDCKHLTNSKLQLEQGKIKEQFSKEELKEYKHLSRLEPYRMRDFGPCGSQE